MAISPLSSSSRFHLVIASPDILPEGRKSALDRLAKAISLPVHCMREELVRPEQLDQLQCEIERATPSRNRNAVLLAGGYLEEHISACALHLLANGFDVFLLRDFIVTREHGARRAIESRLVEAGVVQTTARQMFFEWNITASSQTERDAISAFVNRLSDLQN